MAAAGLFVLLGVSGCEKKDSGGEETGVVTLSVLVGGLPEAGVAVYLHGRDGSLREELATDAAGSVTADVAIDGMITTTYLYSVDYRSIRTIGGVQDGDALEVRFGTAAAVVGTPVVVLGSALNAVEEYVVDAGSCEAYIPGDEPVLATMLSLYPVCVNAANTFDVMATAIDVNFNAKAWALLEDVAVSTTTAYMPVWSTSFASQAITIDDAPAGFFGVGGSLVEEGGLFDIYDDAFIDVKSGHAGVTLSMPSNFGVALNSVYFVYDAMDGYFPIALRYDRRGVIEDTVALDFQTDFYPYIQDAIFQGTNVRPEVTFAAAPTDADYVYFSANWDDGVTFTSWNLLLPPTAEASVGFPELPDGVMPLVGPDYQSLGFYDASYIEGYDEFRTGDVVPPAGDYAVRAALAQP